MKVLKSSKRSISILIATVYLLSSLCATIVLAAVSAQPEGEIGRGKPVFASKTATGNDAIHIPPNANDGDYGTRWYDGDNKNNGNWIYVDLEQDHDISEVVLRWGSDAGTYPKGFELQLLSDGGDPDASDADWRTFKSFGAVSASNAVQTIEVNDSGRYVRVYITAYGTYGTSLYEIEIFEYVVRDYIKMDASEGELIQGANGSGLKMETSPDETVYADGFESSGNGAGVKFTPAYLSANAKTYHTVLGFSRYADEVPDTISVYVNDVFEKQVGLHGGADEPLQTDPFDLLLIRGDTVTVQMDTARGDQGRIRLYYLELEEADETIEFLYKQLRVTPGEQITLQFAKGDYSSVDLVNNDPVVVSLNGNVVTTLAEGIATITAASKDNPEITDTCTIIVSNNHTMWSYEVEGEDGDYINGPGTAIFTRESDTASGGKVADGFYDSGDGAAVTFAMPDDMADTLYELSVQYGRNTYLTDMDYMSIWVNDKYVTRYDCPSTGSYDVYKYGPNPVMVNLKAGDVLKIGVDKSKGDWGMYRLDKLKLTERGYFPPQTITLPENFELLEREVGEIKYGIVPENANTPVIWESSDEHILTVEEGGIYRALSAGTVTVTATSLLNPAVCDTVDITVKTNDKLVTISNADVSVLLDKTFPRVLEYTMVSSGNTIDGNYSNIEQLMVNGTAYTPEVSVSEQKKDELTYAMYLAQLDATIYMRASVQGSVFRLEVVDVEERSEADRVFTLSIPEHSVVSVNTSDQGAQFAGAMANMDVRVSGDTIVDLQTVTTADSQADEYLYGFLSNGKVAAGLYTNAMKSDTTIRTGQGGYQKQVKVYKQTVAEGKGLRTKLSSMAWIYRINDYTKTFEDLPNRYPEEHSGNSKVITHTYKNEPEAEKPYLSVALAEDINNSGAVDWQDAAILLRDEAPAALHEENIQNLVVHRILTQQNGVTSFPFSTITDDTKKVYLRTDGLGQMVLDKFHNEENWGDFTRYDNRLGGLRDFRNMVDELTLNYNSYVGVHSNFYEYQAKTNWFSPEFTRMRADGVTPYNMGFANWGAYLGQMYIVDATADAMSGNRLERMKQFKEDVPNLGFIYNDVFAYTGWNGKAMANDYRNSDIGYFLEYSECNLEEALWGHWAVEQGYNSPGSSGIASDIIRFMWNHTKDRWAGGGHDSVHVADSYNLLMGTDATSFECWPNGDTQFQYDAAMEKVFDNNLPTKFMQHFPILRMEKDDVGWGTHIWFEDDVEVYLDDQGKRTMERGGKVIYNEDSYLIPWDEGIVGNQGLNDIVKLYHWNENGGSTSWELPDEWSGYSTLYLYRLTDQGKVDETKIPVTDGTVTLNGIEKRTAYVLYPGSTENVDVQYGAGDYIADPGFNYGDLRAWTVDKGNPTVERNNSIGDDPDFLIKPFNGQLRNYELMVLDEEEAQVSQIITGLAPGEYAASVRVEIEQGHLRRASILMDVGDLTYSHYTDESAHMNMEIYDPKARTYMQRMRVIFQVPEGEDRVVLRLHTEAGNGVVRFDNPRIYDTITKIPDGADPERVVEYQDFEHALREGVTGNDRYMVTYEGSEPLVNGPGTLKSDGNLRELRSLILQRNEPYTQNGLTGSQWDPYTLNVDDVLDGERTFRTQTSLQGAQGTNTGTIYQTIPETLRLEEGRTYRVSFLYQYQHATAGEYAFVVGSGAHTPGTHRNPDNIEEQVILASTSPATSEADRIGVFSHEFTVDSDDYWIGLFRVKETYTASANPSPFQLDNLLVEDITEGPALRTVHIRNSENGSIHLESSDGSVKNMGRVLSGTYLSVTPEPAEGYELDKLLLNGTEIDWNDPVFVDKDSTLEGIFIKSEEETVDKSQLTALYQAYENKTNDKGYTYDSWTAFTAARTEAKRILDDENASQAEVNAALQSLQEAADGLTTVEKKYLKFSIDIANEIKGNYEDHIIEWVKDRFEAALAEAERVYADPDATQEEVNEAKEDLVRAMHYLMFTANKDLLEDAIDHAEKLLENNRFEENKALQDYKDLINEAKKLLEDDTTTDKEIQDIIKQLEDTEKKLTLKDVIDLRFLAEEIRLAELIVDDLEEKYLDMDQDDFAAFRNALAKAKEIYADPQNQKEVDDAAFDLLKARIELRLKPNKDALGNLINELETLSAKDYTAESWTVLTHAMATARTVYNNPQATAEEVKAAENLLKAAKLQLVPISADPGPDSSESEDPRDSGSEDPHDSDSEDPRGSGSTTDPRGKGKDTGSRVGTSPRTGDSNAVKAFGLFALMSLGIISVLVIRKKHMEK